MLPAEDYNLIFATTILNMVAELSKKFLNEYSRALENYDEHETILSTILANHGKSLTSFAPYYVRYPKADRRRAEIEATDEKMKRKLFKLYLL